MAKINYYKVPVKLKRDSSGEVSMEIRDVEKVFQRSENIATFSSQDIPKISKELSDFNEHSKELTRNTLLASENELETHLIFKYLQ